MNATMTARTNSLTAKLTKVAGVPVEITIRGERSFTVSTEEMDTTAAAQLKSYFEAGGATVTVKHDEECGSFVYVAA